MHNKTLAQHAKSLQNNDYSSEELTRHYLQRIEQYDNRVNSFITVSKKHAIQAAQTADKQRAQGQAGPLTGLPFAHKDIFCTQGIKTSCASKMLDISLHLTMPP